MTSKIVGFSLLIAMAASCCVGTQVNGQTVSRLTDYTIQPATIQNQGQGYVLSDSWGASQTPMKQSVVVGGNCGTAAATNFSDSMNGSYHGSGVIYQVPSQHTSPSHVQPNRSRRTPSLPQGRRYLDGNRYFGPVNNRYYGPQYGYF